MKHNVYNEKFILGLYLYLLQIHLSLTRIDNNWEAFTAFFKRQFPIEKIVDILLNLIENEKFYFYFNFRLINILTRTLTKNIYFKKQDTLKIYTFLIEFQKLLEENKFPGYSCFNELIKKSSLNLLVIKAWLLPNEFKFFVPIIHYNQNFHLKCYDLEQILGEKWI